MAHGLHAPVRSGEEATRGRVFGSGTGGAVARRGTPNPVVGGRRRIVADDGEIVADDDDLVNNGSW